MLNFTTNEIVTLEREVAKPRPYADDQKLVELGKRLFDLVLASLITALILVWLLPLLGLIIKLNSPGPVFFVQLRTGRNKRPFYCLKLRSMTYDPNADFKQAAPNDLRITRVGAFLRKTNLDELPQFLNVLQGHMSIVGPRPHAIQHDAQYWDLLPGYQERYIVKPGITGLAQARGYRGDTSQLWQMRHRVRLDHWYIANRSVLLDVKICGWTLIKMIKKDKHAW